MCDGNWHADICRLQGRGAGGAAGTAPQPGGSGRVPEGYRDLVEEYFRELARQGQQQ